MNSLIGKFLQTQYRPLILFLLRLWFGFKNILRPPIEIFYQKNCNVKHQLLNKIYLFSKKMCPLTYIINNKYDNNKKLKFFCLKFWNLINETPRNSIFLQAFRALYGRKLKNYGTLFGDSLEVMHNEYVVTILHTTINITARDSTG